MYESNYDFSDLGDIDNDVGDNGIIDTMICLEEFSNRKTSEYYYGDVHEFEFKFTRRKGYLPCPWKMKVTFFKDNSEVTVVGVEGATDYVNEEYTDFVEFFSKNYRKEHNFF